MNGINGLIGRDPRRLSVVTDTSDYTQKYEAGGSAWTTKQDPVSKTNKQTNQSGIPKKACFSLSLCEGNGEKPAHCDPEHRASADLIGLYLDLELVNLSEHEQ